MIRFIYEPNQGMVDLIRSNVADYGEDFLYGLLEDQHMLNLKGLAIYLVCEDILTDNGHVYTNPMAIAAKNEFEASRIYYEETNKNSSIMCMLEERASKAKVKRVEDII